MRTLFIQAERDDCTCTFTNGKPFMSASHIISLKNRSIVQCVGLLKKPVMYEIVNQSVNSARGSKISFQLFYPCGFPIEE